MAKVLFLLPQADVDPTEVAVPWFVLNQAGHEITFATQSGLEAVCDQKTLTGEGLPLLLKFLKCRLENARIYAAMSQCRAFQNPISWHNVRTEDFDGLILPGGHAAGMRPYITSSHVHLICTQFFDRQALVGAICHGVMALARAKRNDGRSVLYGYQTTALTNMQERSAIALTRPFMGDYYQTFPITVQDDVTQALEAPDHLCAGPFLYGYGTKAKPERGFIVEDRHYVSARWPGDAWKFANRFLVKLQAGE